MSELIKCLISIDKIFYPKNRAVESGEWSAFSATIEDVYEGEPKTNKRSNLSVSGIVPDINYSDKYILIGKFKMNETYGEQYEIVHMNKLVNLTDPMEQRQFLEYILTDSQINNLYETLDNPFDAIKNSDIKTLTTVKGIGEKTAKQIIQKYKDNVDNGLAYVELDSYGLTKYMIDKLVDVYGSADILVQKIKTNPYILIQDVDGIGWKKADEMALNSGLPKDSMNRLKAYMFYYLRSITEEGDTWTTPQELVQSIFDVAEITNQDEIRQALYDLNKDNTICWNDDKTKIALTKYYILEQHISDNLYRLSIADSDFKLYDYSVKIKEIEKRQGWDYTDEQLQAIKLVAENPVSIITGYGGTGKSSVVSGVLEILRGYSFAQTALSGRAASRLSEITNVDGFTIHRLLEYNPQYGFQRNADNPLDYDIIILDEVSMVGADLFYKLISAIKSGSKLIMIGDDGQLESIGLCNIFKDMLDSGVIPVARLTKIHRQAAKSAIVTESIKVRNHEQLVPYKWVGDEIRGELKDLELNIFSDSILTQKRIIEKFKEIYKQHSNIEDIQIILPQKFRGNISTFKINSIIQDLVNPDGNNETKITIINKGEKIEYVLREQDKVIVNTNNYKTQTVNGEDCPVFNGNKGIIKSIDNYTGRMVIDFEQYGDIIIKHGQWKTIELAYALTCHKLQGSESDYTIIGLDFSGRTLLTKEWLYTAITRAKKYCVLCAETSALSYCITNSNVSYKRTCLKDMLQKEFAS